MKTGITVINDVQVSMDDYKCVRTTKVFDDNCTLLQIKEWIKLSTKAKTEAATMSLAYVEISDIE